MEKYIVVHRESLTNRNLVIGWEGETLRQAATAEMEIMANKTLDTQIYKAIDWVPSEVEKSRND